MITQLLSYLMSLLMLLAQLNGGAPADGSAAKVQAAAASGALSLWPPSRIEAPQVALRFEFSAEQAGSVQAGLKFRPSAAGAAYRQATLLPAKLEAEAAGKGVYRVVWDKSADGVGADEQVDLLLTASDAAGKSAHAELRGFRTGSKAEVRNGVNNYLIYYGAWTDALIDQVKRRYRMVVLDTGSGITPRQIAALRAGADPSDAADDVLVLGYISVGEDKRTIGLTPEQMKKDKRFVLDGSGPATDPRPGAPYPDGAPIPADINQLGTMTHGGFAPYYLNDNYASNKTGKAGVPDFNTYFKGAYVNPGHPLWYKAISDMTLRQDKFSGVRELLTDDFGEGFGIDGLFLDTLDMAEPDSYTNGDSPNQSEFEWTAPGVQSFVRRLTEDYPQALLAGNRGLFFYNPDLSMYNYTLRPYVDFVMFESYRMNSSAGENYNELFFADNKYNYAQKLLAEADRADGFKVLSLGYAEGPDGARMKQALGGKGAAPQEMLEDIDEAVGQMGMAHYMTTAAIDSVNTFVLDHMPLRAAAPVWGSTKTPLVFGKPYDAPRVGVQAASIKDGKLTVRWDVAHAMARPISYALYVKEGAAFDFGADLKAQSVKTVETLPLGVPDDYAGAGDRTSRFPYTATIEGFEPRKTYDVLIRARNAAGESEDNRHVIEVHS